MNENPRCGRCGAELIGQAIGELCANCLLKLALDPPPGATLPLDELPRGSAERCQKPHRVHNTLIIKRD